jgi:hypothetical protein
MINARSETVGTQPAFRDAMKSRRCQRTKQNESDALPGRLRLCSVVCHYEHPKDVLVEHLSELFCFLNPCTSKQFKSKQCSPKHRNGVLVELHSKEWLPVTGLLNSESAVAALGFLVRHNGQYRTDCADLAGVRSHYSEGLR